MTQENKEYEIVARGRILKRQTTNSQTAYVVDIGNGYSVLAKDSFAKRWKHGDVVSVHLSSNSDPVIVSVLGE